MSDIKEKMAKLRERRKAAPKAAPKKIKITKNEMPAIIEQESSSLPVGLLASIVLFIFFGVKYGIKR